MTMFVCVFMTMFVCVFMTMFVLYVHDHVLVHIDLSMHQHSAYDTKSLIDLFRDEPFHAHLFL